MSVLVQDKLPETNGFIVFMPSAFEEFELRLKSTENSLLSTNEFGGGGGVEECFLGLHSHLTGTALFIYLFIFNFTVNLTIHYLLLHSKITHVYMPYCEPEL